MGFRSFFNDRRLHREQLRRQNDVEKLRHELVTSGDRSVLAARRRTARMNRIYGLGRFVLVTVPIVAPMSVAWTGQGGFAMRVLQWSFPSAILYAAAYELTTAFCAWMYHQARSDGDVGLEYRAATWAFALGSAVQQWWHYSSHWHATPRSVTFSTMTVVGVVVWELYARLIHRRHLRSKGLLAGPRAAFRPTSTIHWFRYPLRSWRGWSQSLIPVDADAPPVTEVAAPAEPEPELTPEEELALRMLALRGDRINRDNVARVLRDELQVAVNNYRAGEVAAIGREMHHQLKAI